MRWSATKLRWLLLGGFLLLALVVAGFFSVSRYRAGLIWQRILARNGVNLQRETNGFTYSQSSHGRTVFTLHASKAKPEGKNKWMLQDAVLILYGREPGRDDRIYGKQFEYDQDAGVARALGNVHMDLQTPEPGGKPPAAGTPPVLTFGPDTEAPANSGVIHVETSGLVYMHKLGIAATGQPAEFRYGGLTCTSKGAEFDTGQNTVRLLADVHLSGAVRGRDFVLNATRAELHQKDNTVALTGAVLTSGDRLARAGEALVHLHKDGSVQAAEASGAVELHRGTAAIAAPQMTALFGQDNRPQRAHLFPGVRFTDSDARRPAQGSAGVLDLTWLPTGELATAHATKDVNLGEDGTGRDGATVHRRMKADEAQASFAAGGSGKRALLRHLDLRGGAQAGSASRDVATGAPEETAVAADELVTEFRTGPRGEPEADQLQGTGHTRLDQLQASGARQGSSGATLEIRFAPDNGERKGAGAILSATQTGGVEVESRAAEKTPGAAAAGSGQPPELTTGHADRAVFAGTENSLTLFGTGEQAATLQQTGGELSAGTIVLQQGTGDAEATGHVVATGAGNGDGPATHILAAKAELLRGPKISIFSGDARAPAQLWQGGSQVQAAEITLDGRTHGLAARPARAGELIHAAFATAERSGPAPRKSSSGGQTAPASKALAGQTATAAARDTVRVDAEQMDFDDQRREAVFSGHVHVSGATGEVSADRSSAFLLPSKQSRGSGKGTEQTAGQVMAPGLNGSLERIVMSGDVHLLQPGRSGTGEQLTYVAGTDSYILTGTPGKPPRVTGGENSVVTGATLLFRGTDDTVVVAGTKGEHAAGPARVHVETDLK